MHVLAKVEPKENVVVLAAGSGVGTSVIQLLKAHGATSIAVAGSPAKLEMAKTLGASQTINYKTQTMSDAVLAATEGKGSDVLLDCIGDMEANMKAIRDDGRVVLYGLLGGNKQIGIRQFLWKNMQLISSTLRKRPVAYKTKLIADFAKDVIPLFERKEVAVIVDKVFQMTDIGQAHTYMEQNKNIGKIIVTVISTDANLSSAKSEL